MQENARGRNISSAFSLFVAFLDLSFSYTRHRQLSSSRINIKARKGKNSNAHWKDDKASIKRPQTLLRSVSHINALKTFFLLNSG